MADPTSPAVPYCHACGTENPPGARFCRQCGAPLAQAPTVQAQTVQTPTVQAPPAAVAETAPSAPAAPDPAPPPQGPAPSDAETPRAYPGSPSPAPPLVPQAAVTTPYPGPAEPPPVPLPTRTGAARGEQGGILERARQRPLLAGGAVAAVVALVAAVVFLAGPVLDALSPKVTEYANRDLTVASSMDQSARTRERVARGAALHGHWVNGPGGQARWLKVALSEGLSGYVWGRDLSDRAPPDLTPERQFATASAKSLVYAEPDSGSRVVDELDAGESAPQVSANVNASWSEIELPQGGVGYVPTSVFSGSGADAGASRSPAETGELASLKHYVCTVSDGAGPDTPAQISLYLDEGRNCINHRYMYGADDAGALQRVLLNDIGKTGAVLTFSADRGTFTRTDYRIDHAAYDRIKRDAATLDSLTCAAPGDDKAQASLETLLKKATPKLDSDSGGVVAHRVSWRCAQTQ